MKNKHSSRREFLKISVGTVAGMYTNDLLASPHHAPGGMKIGIQLYCVRKECAVDFAATIEQVAQAGFKGVEFADYFGYSALEIRKMLDEPVLMCAVAIFIRKRYWAVN